MSRLAIGTLLLCVTTSITIHAQEPVAGARFHIQLVSSDTGVVSLKRDSRLLTASQISMFFVSCIRPDSGMWKRESRECGPRPRPWLQKLLADTTVTADAHGHVRQRLTWAGGDAVVELDAADRTMVNSREQMRLKVGFWPRLAHGADAPPAGALRMTYATASYGQLVAMTVNFKDGAQVLLVLLER